jgi:lysyl-tRNA synthetase class 2
MECYWAYKNYADMMNFTEKLYKEVIKKTFGTLEIQSNGHMINWGEKWEKIEYIKIFENETGINLKKAKDNDLFKKAKELNIKLEDNIGRGKLIDLIYKKIVRPKLIKPSFLINPPIELEPLAKRLDDDPNRVARFQIMALGTELGKGFSELNDPIDQRQRFEEQMKLREQGDKEAQRLDEEFLEALEYGMPPAAGFGMSERLFAVLIDKPVREAVFFPLMRSD